MKVGRSGASRFSLGAGAYCNKELCCLRQWWLASKAAARADWDGGVQVGRHTGGGDSGQPGAAMQTLVQVVAG